jgi:hypothetical protein
MSKLRESSLGAVVGLIRHDDHVLNSTRNLLSYREHIGNFGFLDAIDQKADSRFVYRVNQLGNICTIHGQEPN